MRSLDDVVRFFDRPYIGTIETGVAQGWWLIKHLVPNIRMVVIHRPIEDCVASMLATDIEGVATYDEAIIRRSFRYGDRMLSQISQVPGVLSVEFDELATPLGCKKVWDFCLPYVFDEAWYRQLKDVNIQVDMKAFLSHYFTIKNQVEEFKSLCFTELRKLRKSGVELRGAM